MTTLFRHPCDCGAVIEEVPVPDPLTLFAPLANEPFALFLDSATPPIPPATHKENRWSFVTCAPYDTLVLSGREAHTDPFGLVDKKLTPEAGDITRQIRQAFEQHALTPPPFLGGAAGVFSYELGYLLEKNMVHRRPKGTTPLLALGFYSTVLAFDHAENRAFLIASGWPATTPAARRTDAKAALHVWRTRLARLSPLKPLTWPAKPRNASVIRWQESAATYKKKVARVIDYIHAGDIFQANLSRRFQTSLPPGEDSFTLYRRLRTHSPAPFAGYFHFGSGTLLSSSPEQFLRCQDTHVTARPIKGTRARGTTPAEDQALARALTSSEKDRAENVMIVDLLRNDLSRVCKEGSIRVEELCALKSYANVHHLVSTITGQLRPEETSLTLLRAAFPGGSITGAPKIRAMQIIRELETSARGPYCGSLGYIGFDGTMNTNIGIRVATVTHNEVTFSAGGGIVADSDPAAEHEETLAKASALRAACLCFKPAPVLPENRRISA